MIGERLLDLRKDAGLTQDQLASLLKINKHSISSYERDKSEPPDVLKIGIARHFGVSVDYLLGLTDNPNPYGGQHNIIRLPDDFPQDAKQSLLDYMEFLKDRYSKADNKDGR